MIWRRLLERVSGGHSHGLEWLPARALMGEAIPMLAMMSIGIIATMAISSALGQTYGSGLLNHLAAPGATKTIVLSRRFQNGPFGSLLRKEALLLVRHPGLWAQLFYQFLFLVPGVIALLKVGEAGKFHAMGGVVFLVTMMTGRIAKIIAAGPFESDQAAALAATSPISETLVVRAKLLVTGAMIAAVIGLSLLTVWSQAPAALLPVGLACTAAAMTRVKLSMESPREFRRTGLDGRLPANVGKLLGIMLDFGWSLLGLLLAWAL